MKRTKILIAGIVVALLGLLTINAQSDPKASQLISELEAAVGSWEALYARNDVQFDYDYHYPQQGKRDYSTERYIFEGEHSWAKYSTHEINTMPDKEGVVVQACVDNKTVCTLDGSVVEDPKAVGTADFLRRANYFWFTMNFKLANPGARHQYMGSELVHGVTYEKVQVTYDAVSTGKEQNDGYLLYINAETGLVDHFYFSLPALGVNDIVLKMELDYSDFEGIKIPTKRLIYMPGPDGELSDEASLVQTLKEVKFNNGFKPEDFKV